MQPNTSSSQEHQTIEAIARAFRTLSQPARLQILLAIGTGEACVCHLESSLDYRQAYISQQLMALRDAGIVTSRRAGRNIFYRLENPGFLDLIDCLVGMLGLPGENLSFTTKFFYPASCSCPKCKRNKEW